VGFGNGTALACMAVQISSSIANVFIKEMSLDFISSPALRIGAVFFVLGKERAVDWEKRKKEFDDKMKLDFSRDGQLIVVSRDLTPDKAIPLSLSKLARSEMLKIMAAGSAINRAVSLALELAKGDIAKEPIGIEFVVLSTIRFKIENADVQGTGIEIYLRKGVQTVYTPKHKEITKMLQQK